MPLTASAISDRLGGASDVDVGRLTAHVDGTGLLRKTFEGAHREGGEQPAGHRRGADGARADHDHPAVQVVGVGDRGVVGGADGGRRRPLGTVELHRAHPVPHAVDRGVGISGG